jgi:hypothetical protein
MKKNVFLFALAICLNTVFVSAQKNKDATIVWNYEVYCMGKGNTGTQFFKVYGFGKKADDAIHMCKKNAVHAVIFKGISTGEDGCRKNPIVTESGAEQKHAEYFKAFFADGGKYLSYVNLSGDGTVDPNDRLKVGKDYKIGIGVVVDSDRLKRELEDAGVVRKGF